MVWFWRILYGWICFIIGFMASAIITASHEDDKYAKMLSEMDGKDEGNGEMPPPKEKGKTTGGKIIAVLIGMSIGFIMVKAVDFFCNIF